MSAPDLNAAARELCALTISGSDAPDLAARFREHWDNGGFPAEQRTEWERRAQLVLDAAYPATRETVRPWTPATSELAQRLRATEPLTEPHPFMRTAALRSNISTERERKHHGSVDPTDPRAPEHREDD